MLLKLTSLEQVQKRVGKLPAPRDLKVIDHIDEHARRWLSYTRFGFFGFGNDGHIQLSAAGGGEGFVSVLDARHLLIPLSALDTGSIVENGLSFGALFIVSGMDETLRVNGTVVNVADGLLSLEVEECYLHCAKAFRRSNFWAPRSFERSNDAVSEYIQQATFLALATINSSGQADVSPKGDPENFLIQEEEGIIYLADRPGNRRIDSFRNIIEQPKVSIIAMVPGCKDILVLRGTAALCTDEGLLQRFTVQGKEPLIVTKINPSAMQIKPSIALTESALWPSQMAPKDLIPSEIFKSHIKQSKENSIQAKIARAAVSLPGAMEKGLALDYKKNMY
jgi:predicted pyridoxine 5'-phosphate oxidase superfamily flavin-nucleotide-binding protein